MNWLVRPKIAKQQSGSRRRLVIGLVNNTSDRGLKAVERHFVGLMYAACGDNELTFRYFTSPRIQRGTRPQGLQGEPYDDIARLFDTRLDAVIVTGMEPQASTLRDEPLFATLVGIVDWAEQHAIPVLWSCLAAHAAVLHLDAISRMPLAQKLSGVFDCEVLAGHPLTNGLPSRIGIPHSRHHGLPEALLRARGYAILSRSDEAGVDIFAKHGSAPFVFCQGHPEYDADTLLLEYRRDVRRYLVGEAPHFPPPPRNYFDPETAAKLARIGEEISCGPLDLIRLDEVTALTGGALWPSPWQSFARQFAANWLGGIVPGCIVKDDYAAREAVG